VVAHHPPGIMTTVFAFIVTLYLILEGIACSPGLTLLRIEPLGGSWSWQVPSPVAALWLPVSPPVRKARKLHPLLLHVRRSILQGDG
jgi:hypothetical protein